MCHPALVAERIVRYAQVVGKERVIAGADCGFGTMLEAGGVDTRIVWAFLEPKPTGIAQKCQRSQGQPSSVVLG